MAQSLRHYAPRVFRIGVVLAIIMSVPLAGVAWFSTSAVREAEAERARVADVRDHIDHLVALSDLRTKLLEERNWTSAANGIDEIGLSSAVVEALVGVNLADEASGASAAVDQLVAELGLDEVRSQLEAIRATVEGSLEESSRLYVELEQSIGQQASVMFEDLLDDAVAIRDEGQVVDTLRILEASTLARQSIATEFNRYFDAVFSQPSERQEQLLALASAEALRQEALAKVSRLADPGSRTFQVANEISGSAEAEEFAAAVNNLVSGSLVGERTHALSVSSLADLNGLAATFEASTAATDLYLSLVNAAGEDVERASRDAVSGAESRNQRALIYLMAVIAASVGVALGATRVIVQPLHRLAHGARRIRDGEPPQLDARGPIEVREAAWAIDEAGVQLDLAARQALALAEGDLDNPALQDPGPGNLGRSLQAAVRNLATSLNEREEFRRRIAHEASHDGLTQLPNRNASLDQLERGLARTARSSMQLAVLFIDLDGFKRINDLHGHQAGDAVLRVTAQRLVAAVREGDHVGRLGGDEFVVIAEPIDGVDVALALAHRIIAAIGCPIQDGDVHATVAASIGIAINSEPGAAASDLLRDADLAVYRAKSQGRGRAQICDEQLRSEIVEKADLEQALHSAITNDEFVLHYQPTVKPDRSQPVAYEALIRWNRPGHPLVPPDSFIPFAERSELIIAIDCWVIRSVAAQIADWDRCDRPEVPIAINISAKHLASPRFIDNLLEPLAHHGVDPSRLIVEVTESALLHDLSLAAVKLQNLRSRGVRIAIDDFGTGYTSLAHLRTLPVDILKIDRSFTNDPTALSLVKLIIDTGHLLGATVTAEGIETAAQAAQIEALGADDLQGYLYGRPAPAADLAPIAVH
ncbi:MAG: EAL domain-containing protein [Thermoanaerobaculia bacterium]